MDISPYDAIVVGSGATGGIAALTLAEQGIKVLVIEAGPQVKRHEASNHEPKSTLKRLSGVLTKKHLWSLRLVCLHFQTAYYKHKNPPS